MTRASNVTVHAVGQRIIVLGWTMILMTMSCIGAPYPNELLLQHIPTVIGLILLLVAVIWVQPSSLSFYSCLGFIGLHLVGARWIYSYVPYDLWLETISGYSLSETFGWKRNHYDRLVHFGFGVFAMAPLTEALQTFCRMRPWPAILTSVAWVLALGAIYEILEWQVAVILSPQFAESYNGQQGDVWDPQKDMALAWLGAMIAAPFIHLCSRSERAL